MKKVTIAALAAAQLTALAAPATAAELPRDVAAGQPAASPGARLREDVELSLRDGQVPEPRIGTASQSPLAAAAQEEREPRKKRKSTGDKVLTGAAIVLGVGALAVGGLLVAIFVN